KTHKSRTRSKKTESLFLQAEDGIRDPNVTGVQTCALPIFDKQALRRGINNIILENVVRRVVLDLKLTAPCVFRIVLEQGVIDNRAVVSAAHVAGVSSNRDADRIRRIH